MTEKNRFESGSADDSALNPSGAARRRLLKAVGLGALALPLSLEWQQPKVRFGGLPAHAIATINGCFVGVSMTVSGSSGADGSFGVALVGTGGTLDSTTWSQSSSTYLVGFNGSQPPNQSEPISVFWTKQNSENEIAVISEAYCCDESTGTPGSICFESTSGSYQLLEFATGDDGICEILLSIS